MWIDVEYLDCNGDLDFDELVEEIEQEIKITNKVWTTKDGRDIKIKDMSTRHISNTMKMIIRNSGFSEDSVRYLNLFIDEIVKRIKE